MFDFGAGEVLGLVVLALILVGPERMPRVAGDLAKMIRKVRAMTNTATAEIRENLGPGFEDLTPSDLNPKTFMSHQFSMKKMRKMARANPERAHLSLRLIQIFYDSH
jgi:sec-independent protein translocase protein TatB